uniref:Transposase n=1 Tax=Macrostomum lignano TaxID=282301 RepID=A0A1I8F550_9PLAT
MPGCWTGPASSSRAVVDWSARTKMLRFCRRRRTSFARWFGRIGHRIGASSTYCDRLLRQLLSRHAEILACCDGHPVAEDSATTGAIDGRGVDEEACNGIGDNSSAFVRPATGGAAFAKCSPTAAPRSHSLSFAAPGAPPARLLRHEDSGADLAMCQELLDDMLRQVEQLAPGQRPRLNWRLACRPIAVAPGFVFSNAAPLPARHTACAGERRSGAPSLPGAIGASALS